MRLWVAEHAQPAEDWICHLGPVYVTDLLASHLDFYMPQVNKPEYESLLANFVPIAVHVQVEPGRFSTQPEHIYAHKISGVERGSAWLLNKISFIGPQAAGWAAAMVQQRGIEGVRVLQGLLRLADQHSAASIEQACQAARRHGAYRLRAVRELLDRQADQQEQFEFVQADPIIRSLGEYEDLVKTAFTKEPSR